MVFSTLLINAAAAAVAAGKQELLNIITNCIEIAVGQFFQCSQQPPRQPPRQKPRLLPLWLPL